MHININRIQMPKVLQKGIHELISQNFIPKISSQSGVKLTFIQDTSANEITIKNDCNSINITFSKLNDAFRTLGTLIGQNNLQEKTISTEIRRLKKIYIMLDVSRNAVMKVETIKNWIRNLALMGINGLMLYTEDTYKIDNEPYFGYMRGGYSKQELKILNDYAEIFGIEMVPCIQTLAHLNRVLCHSKFNNIKDTPSILLCNNSETYTFIEKMIDNATIPYSSKKIHIGMDEALNLGRGVFLDKFGYKPSFEIMSTHLEKVMKIINNFGLNAYMWSDMFFRAESPTGEYFDSSITFSNKTKNKAPSEINLVYWDYFHKKTSEYDRMISMHKELNGKRPIIAPGIHTWNRFWPAYSYSMQRIETALKSALSNDLEECIITLWGDDGTECNFQTALPLIRYASDIVFNKNNDIKNTKIILKNTMSIDFDKWKKPEELDNTPNNKTNDNISKMLLWEDPLTGLCQLQKKHKYLNNFYKNLAINLKTNCNLDKTSPLFLPYLIADILSLKADLPEQILDAYKNNKQADLEYFSNTVIPKLIQKLISLKNHHRNVWMQNNKPFGWDVLERRYGGTISVLDNLKFRLDAFLSGNITKIEELETKRLQLFPPRKDGFPLTLCYNHFFTTAYSGH
jgi:hypothetical protein